MKPLVSSDVTVNVNLPEQNLSFPLRITVVPGPEPRKPLSNQKIAIAVVVGVVVLVVLCVGSFALGWFISNYQINL